MSDRQNIAEAFGTTLDPLAQFEGTFADVDIDPFDPFRDNRIESRNLAANTRKNYERAIKQFTEYMAEQGRHPACPNEEHTTGFVDYCINDRGNAPSSVRTKLKNLNSIYNYWQDDAAFPHDTDYNPWTEGLERVSAMINSDTDNPEPPRLTPSQLREKMAGVSHVRDKLVIAMQLKFGLRATELANVRLSDIHVDNSELLAHYPDMATAAKLDGLENAIYISHEREGNKSQRPRVLPLDEEMRMLLTRYLLTRPDNGESALILSSTRHEPMTNAGINEVWREYFSEYDGSGKYKAITSHYGRHRFTTYWQVEQDIGRELVKYMRGDANGGMNGFEGIDHYLHTYYEDIEGIYRERIYSLLE